MFRLTNEIVVISVIVVIMMIYAMSKCSMNCSGNISSKEGIIYPEPEPGHRPSIGDFLPTVGDVASEGGYVVEDSIPTLDVTLCEECINNNIDWVVQHGTSKGLTYDRAWAKRYCDIECQSANTF